MKLQQKIFWFQRRHPRDGTIMPGYLDCDEQSAFDFINKPRKFFYAGWSDGRFLKELKDQIPKPDKDQKTGMIEKESEEVHQLLVDAREKEIEFAINNPDKKGPRNLSSFNIQGGIQDDPRITGQAQALAGKK